MKTHLEYIVELSKTGKTKVITVISVHDKTTLGQISWWGSWRCYVFIPVMKYSTIWSDDCLEELMKYIRNLNDEQKGTW